eukprot:scaffold19253_cov124-Isochrysis_galbana.AAC.5
MTVIDRYVGPVVFVARCRRGNPQGASRADEHGHGKHMAIGVRASYTDHDRPTAIPRGTLDPT